VSENGHVPADNGWLFWLGCLLDQPIAEVQVFLDLAPFVAVFLGFFGAVIRVAEGMFATAYCFSNNVQRFCHNWHSFLKVPLFSVYCANCDCSLLPVNKQILPQGSGVVKVFGLEFPRMVQKKLEEF
jgi:hypothetical protein